MERIIADCVNYIETHLKSHWTVTELAERYHYSPFHFARLFKEITGSTLATYIRQRKLCHTLYDISQGQPKQQAALDYGFQSYSGFYRAFTQVYGCGPKVYLKIHSIDKPVCPNILERGQVMYTKTELIKLITTNWTFPAITSITPLDTEHIRHQVWVINHDYILKKGQYDELDKHARICAGLINEGIASQEIYLTNKECPILQLDAGDFILMKSLVGEPLTMTALFSEKMTLYANEQGRALAKLHRVLGSLSSDLIDTYDLITTLENWALPETTKVALQWQLDLPSGFADALLSKVNTLFPRLPQQVIHRDPNPGNILYSGTKVSGFIDFDISVKSQRLFDLCYMGTAILSHLTKPSHYRQWPQLFQELITGYHQEEPLTEEERQAIFPMLCSIQMIAIAYFSHVNEWQEVARVNRENLVYLYAIQDEFDIRLQTM
ncbi:helix-turn-helix domain-containing protein [Vagococcus sp. BWB3-3]|uniref:Helix-turn-helix domain-containing protein n=1 Tax=Vagococcus allomyrinae TaxID=2794353 RepID=A0A940PBK5_9ENTE|nr:helix-turn-helix domain-containing protein [Vagococcus allomyrinae]MBP1041537.1 helix-turn-helix domain-containing protein [Vagococcus allomyrinae]